jgi:hypothetical protein
LIATLPIYTSTPHDWPRIRDCPLAARYRSTRGDAAAASIEDCKFLSELPAFLADTSIWGTPSNFPFAADLSQAIHLFHRRRGDNMRLRLPGRRPRAWSATGLLLACGIAVWCCAARAQEFVAEDDPAYSSVGSAPSSGYALHDDGVPAWQVDYNECCSDDCGGSYDDCLGCKDSCICGSRWWVAAEYLLWKTDSTHLPPLVTDSPILTAPVLSSPATQVVSEQKIANSWRSGYRLEVGAWLDDCNTVAIVGNYFNAGDDDYDYYFPGDSGRNTGRPYFNTQAGAQFVDPISGTYPNSPNPNIVRDGTISISADDDFQGGGITLERCVYSVGAPAGFGPGTQVILLSGYRYFGYSSNLSIDGTSTVLSGAGDGDFISRRDVFNANNVFNGGEIGAKVRFTQQACWFDGMFKIALGGHRRTVVINGETVSIPDGVPAEVSQGGLLTAEGTNIGSYSDTRARIIPEFRIGVGVFLTPQWTIRAGVSAIAWSGVVRAADGLPPNLAVDTRNIPGGIGGGGVSPVFSGLGGSEFVATGLDLGMEYNY